MSTRFGILGTIEMWQDGTAVDVGHGMQQRVLAALLVEAGQVVSADALVDRVWGDSELAYGRRKLYGYVSRLRRALAAGDVAVARERGGGYRLVVEPSAVDAHRFHELSSRARTARSDGQAAALWQDALALWRGSAFGEVDTPWFNAQRHLLEGERLAAELELVDVRLRLGQHEALVSELAARVEAYPLDERVIGQLMLASYRCGRRAEALQVYERARHRLIEELGVEAGADLQRLFERILAGDPELGDTLPTSTVVSASNGQTRPQRVSPEMLLPDSDMPDDDVVRLQQVGQTLAEVQAPGKEDTSGPTNVPPCLLPPARLPLLGREEEIQLANGVLQPAGSGPQCLIITGPAGVGKTSLAVYLGHHFLDDFSDGQLYADLGGLGSAEDPRRVLAGFLRALGVPNATVPSGYEERIDLYRTLLARRRVLVVLDNVADTRAATSLLPNGLGCRAIITARSSVAGISGTRLRLPHLRTNDAIALLSHMAGGDRAAAERSEAHRIVEECGRLPLAVWVIGARLAARPHMLLGDMARALADERRKLDELTVGDVAVRASIELSYRHLRPPAQRLLRLMSLSDPAHLTGWIAAALAGTDLEGAESLLDELLELHLVEVRSASSGRTRYRMHDIVAAFAREEANQEDPESQRALALERVLGAALQLAQAADTQLSADFHGVTRHHHEPRWTLPDDDVRRLLSPPLSWFDTEHDFLLRLVERLIGSNATIAGCLAVSMTSYLQIRGHHDEWRRLQQLALKGVVTAGDRRTAVKLHRSLGELATIVDHYSEAIEHFQQAMDPPVPEEPDYNASATAGLAYVYRLIGRQSDALEYFERAAATARAADNANLLTYAVNGIGAIRFERGDLADAEDAFKESLRLSGLIGYRPGEALALRSLGQVHRARGDHDIAAQHFARSEAVSLAMGDKLGATHARCWLGDAQVRLGAPAAARRLLATCLHVYRECANEWGEAATLLNLGHAQLAAGRPQIAYLRTTAAAAIWRRLNAYYWLAQALDQAASAADLLGQAANAERARTEAREARTHLT